MEQAVIVHVALKSGHKFGSPEEIAEISALSNDLETIISQQSLGEFDGDDYGQGTCMLYMYGSSADALFEAIEARVRSSSICKGGYVVKRYGEAGQRDVKKLRIQL